MARFPFAWYQAVIGSSLDATAKTATLISFDTETDQYTIPGGVTVAIADLFDVSVSDDNQDLELAYYNASATGTKNLATGYIDQGLKFHPLGVDGDNKAILVDGTNNKLWRTVTITIKVKDSVPATVTSTDGSATIVTGAEALKSLKNAPAKIDVSIQAAGGSRGRAFKTAASADDTSAVNLTVDSVNGDSLASLITADGGQAKTVGDEPVTLTYTAYVYIEGGSQVTGSAQDDGNSGVASGAFTVTVAKHA